MRNLIRFWGSSDITDGIFWVNWFGILKILAQTEPWRNQYGSPKVRTYLRREFRKGWVGFAPGQVCHPQRRPVFRIFNFYQYLWQVLLIHEERIFYTVIHITFILFFMLIHIIFKFMTWVGYSSLFLINDNIPQRPLAPLPIYLCCPVTVTNSWATAIQYVQSEICSKHMLDFKKFI